MVIDLKILFSKKKTRRRTIQKKKFDASLYADRVDSAMSLPDVPLASDSEEVPPEELFQMILKHTPKGIREAKRVSCMSKMDQLSSFRSDFEREDTHFSRTPSQSALFARSKFVKMDSRSQMGSSTSVISGLDSGSSCSDERGRKIATISKRRSKDCATARRVSEVARSSSPKPAQSNRSKFRLSARESYSTSPPERYSTPPADSKFQVYTPRAQSTNIIPCTVSPKLSNVDTSSIRSDESEHPTRWRKRIDSAFTFESILGDALEDFCSDEEEEESCESSVTFSSLIGGDDESYSDFTNPQASRKSTKLSVNGTYLPEDSDYSEFDDPYRFTQGAFSSRSGINIEEFAILANGNRVPLGFDVESSTSTHV